MIDICTWTMLNGRKVPVLPDEPGVRHKDFLIEITMGEQFDPGFPQIAPNNRNTAILRQSTGIHR